MEADEGDVVYLGEEHGDMPGVDTENEQCGVDDAGPETGTEAEAETEADDGQFVVQVDDDEGGSEGKNDEKKDDNMLVVDELDNEDLQSVSDQGDTAEQGPMLDPDLSERHLLTMPSLKAVMGDLLHLRRNRRVSIYPLSLDDVNHADIQKILNSDKCEEAKLQLVRPSTDMSSWAGFLSITLVTSTAAQSVIEALKSFKDGLTVKLDVNPDQSVETFIKSERKSAAWPAYWSNKLLLVRGLSSEAKLEDLQPVFPGAEEIIVCKDPKMTQPQVGKRQANAAIAKRYDGYAYVLYDDVEKAKAVVDEYTEDPPMYVDRRLDVKFYREPVPEIPRALLWLRHRKVVLKHLRKLTDNLEKSKTDPNFQLQPDTEKRVTLCKEIIEKDDQQRQQFGLPTPSLEDYKSIRGLKPLKQFVFQRFLANLGLIERKKPPPKDGKPGSAAGGFRGKDKRGRGRGRGRGGRGGRGGFSSAEFRPPPSRRGWGNRPATRERYMGRSVGELQADAFGVMNQLARIMQQPSLGMMGSSMMNQPSMMMGGGSGSLGGAGPVNMPYGGHSGPGHKPPSKMMRMDDTGGLHGFQDRDMRMYNRDDPHRYSDRPAFGHRSHSPEYRAPPQRSQRGGRTGPVGPSRGYDSAGSGRSGDYDIGLLMNLSKMLSQNIEQKRHMY